MRWALSHCSPLADLTGLFLAALGMDVHVHDTYFVIAHFHFIMVGGMVMAYMAAMHYLVAQDLGPDVSGALGETGCHDHFCWFCAHVSPAVCVGL